MERPGARQLLLGLWVACSALSGIRGDFCDVNHCQNGGTCLKSLDQSPFFCLCAEGFTGPTCNETEKGPCNPSPCKNKGECRLLPNRGDALNEYQCICRPGYSGKHCQYNVNECLSQPCKNGGTCLNLKGNFDCKCLSPYVGKTCQTRCKDELGMQTRAIADTQLSASSIYHGLMSMQRWAPELARLHNSGFVNAWRASNEDKKPWLQINLLKKMFLSGVVTQGAGRLGASEFVRTFKVSYSLDGRVFEFYKDENQNHEKIFSGNTDKYTAVTNMFNSPVIAQYFRIHPVTYEGGYTLRVELIGCEMNGCSNPLGVKSHRISDQQITASSVYKTWGLSSMTWHPYYARLDNTGKSNAWTALRNQPGEWLQVPNGGHVTPGHCNRRKYESVSKHLNFDHVTKGDAAMMIDLLKVKKVSGIITQGARDFGHIQYVAAYKVAYSNDGKSWTVYHDDRTNSVKLFQGNHDNNSHKRNMFDVPFHARFVRILPEAWHNRITLRVELLGCDE